MTFCKFIQLPDIFKAIIKIKNPYLNEWKTFNQFHFNITNPVSVLKDNFIESRKKLLKPYIKARINYAAEPSHHSIPTHNKKRNIRNKEYNSLDKFDDN